MMESKQVCTRRSIWGRILCVLLVPVVFIGAMPTSALAGEIMKRVIDNMDYMIQLSGYGDGAAVYRSGMKMSANLNAGQVAGYLDELLSDYIEPLLADMEDTNLYAQTHSDKYEMSEQVEDALWQLRGLQDEIDSMYSIIEESREYIYYQTLYLQQGVYTDYHTQENIAYEITKRAEHVTQLMERVIAQQVEWETQITGCQALYDGNVDADSDDYALSQNIVQMKTDNMNRLMQLAEEIETRENSESNDPSIVVNVVSTSQLGFYLIDEDGNPIQGAKIRVFESEKGPETTYDTIITTNDKGIAKLNVKSLQKPETKLYVDVGFEITAPGYHTHFSAGNIYQGGDIITQSFEKNNGSGAYLAGASINGRDTMWETTTLYITPKNTAKQSIQLYILDENGGTPTTGIDPEVHYLDQDNKEVTLKAKLENGIWTAQDQLCCKLKEECAENPITVKIGNRTDRVAIKTRKAVIQEPKTMSGTDVFSKLLGTGIGVKIPSGIPFLENILFNVELPVPGIDMIKVFTDVSGKWVIAFGSAKENSVLDALNQKDAWKTEDRRLVDQTVNLLHEVRGEDKESAKRDVLNAFSDVKKTICMGSVDGWWTVNIVASGNMDGTAGEVIGSLIGGFKGEWAWNFIFPTPSIPMVATLGFKIGMGFGVGMTYKAQTKFDKTGQPYLDGSSVKYAMSIQFLMTVSFTASLGIGTGYGNFNVFSIGIAGMMSLNFSIPLIGRDVQNVDALSFSFSGALNVFVKLLFFKWTLPIVDGGYTYEHGSGKWSGKILGKSINRSINDGDVPEIEAADPSAGITSGETPTETKKNVDLEKTPYVNASAILDKDHYSKCNTVLLDSNNNADDYLIYVEYDESKREYQLWAKDVTEGSWYGKEFCLQEQLPGDPLKMTIATYYDQSFHYGDLLSQGRVYISALLYTYVTKWEEQSVETDPTSGTTNVVKTPAETKTQLFFLASPRYRSVTGWKRERPRLIPFKDDGQTVKTSITLDFLHENEAYTQLDSMYIHDLQADRRAERNIWIPLIRKFRITTTVKYKEVTYDVVLQSDGNGGTEANKGIGFVDLKLKKAVHYAKGPIGSIGFCVYHLELARDVKHKGQYALKRIEYRYTQERTEEGDYSYYWGVYPKIKEVVLAYGDITDFAVLRDDSVFRAYYLKRCEKDADGNKETRLFSVTDDGKTGGFTITDHDIVVNSQTLESAPTTIFGRKALWWLQYNSSEDGKSSDPRLMAVFFDNNNITSPCTLAVVRDTVSADDSIGTNDTHIVSTPYLLASSQIGTAYLVLPSVWGNSENGTDSYSDTCYTTSIAAVKPSVICDVVGMAPTLPLVTAGKSGKVTFTVNNLSNVPLSALQLTFYTIKDGKEQVLNSCTINMKDPVKSVNYAFDDSGEIALTEEGEQGAYLIQGIFDTENGDFHAIREMHYASQSDDSPSSKSYTQATNLFMPNAVKSAAATFSIPIDWEGDKTIYMRTQGAIVSADPMSTYGSDSDSEPVQAYYVPLDDNANGVVQAYPCGTTDNFMDYLIVGENGAVSVSTEAGALILNARNEEAEEYEEDEVFNEVIAVGDTESWTATVSELRTDYRQFEMNGEEYITFTVNAEGDTANVSERGVTVTAWIDDEDQPTYIHTFRTPMVSGMGFSITVPVSKLTGGKAADNLYLSVIDNTKGNTELTSVNNIQSFFIGNGLKFTRDLTDKKVTIGKSAVFSVEAAGGTKPYTYEWAYCLPGTEGKWIKIEGADGPMLQVDKVTKEMQGVAICCRVTDANGQRIISTIATLTVLDPPDTGDHTNLQLLSLLLAFSLIGFIAIAARKRGKRRE